MRGAISGALAALLIPCAVAAVSTQQCQAKSGGFFDFLFSGKTQSEPAREGVDKNPSKSKPAHLEKKPAGKTAAKPSEARIFARDFGAIPDDGLSDSAQIQAALNALSKLENTTLVFEDGTYHLDISPSGKNRVLILENAKNVSVDGGGALFIQSDNALGFMTLDYCENVSVRNMSLDFQKPPYAAGTVESVCENSEGFIVKTLEGCPDFASASLRGSDGGFFLSAETPGAIYEGTDAVRITKTEKLSGGLFKISLDLKKGVENLKNVKSGAVFVQVCKRSAAAMGGTRLKNCALENIKVYASGAGAFTFSHSDGLKFLNCASKIAEGRVKAINADGFHLPNCRNVEISDCLIEGASDDCLNMYLTPSYVQKAVSEREFIVNKAYNGKPSSIDAHEFSKGDELAFFCALSGEIFARAKVENFDASTRLLSLDSPVGAVAEGFDKKSSTTIYNLSNSKGLTVKNSVFKDSSRYGLYIKASDVQIQNCKFERLGSSGIVMCNEPGWPEGLGCERVKIDSCVFDSCGRLCYALTRWPGGDITCMAIGVRFGAERQALKKSGANLAEDGNAFLNSDIAVSGCKFANWVGRAVYLRSTKNISIEGCEFSKPKLHPLPNARTALETVRADGCKNIVLNGNANLSDLPELTER